MQNAIVQLIRRFKSTVEYVMRFLVAKDTGIQTVSISMGFINVPVGANLIRNYTICIIFVGGR